MDKNSEYQQTLDFLFTRLQSFHNVGATAYKPGLDTAIKLATSFGNPHREFKTIHVGGTNGKGSTAHTLAAILQSAGYRVGLYTSPHLIDFRERMRVNGQMISETEVIDFVNRFREMNIDCSPSFFELTTIMAFEFFARQKVDIAVIEVGLGGRLDTTNIITPLLSVITNISLDHTALLGNTLEAIAGEKAGIIKPGVPVVIGESRGGVREVFADKARECASPIVYADDSEIFSDYEETDGTVIYHSTPWGDVHSELTGECQHLNAATIMCAVKVLIERGLNITDEAVKQGFMNVTRLTGLMGRWTTLRVNPTVICDTGHNPGGWQYLGDILRRMAAAPGHLHMVVGFVNDKDVSTIMCYMPTDATYYFVKPSVDRGAQSTEIQSTAAAHSIHGAAFDSVAQGYEAALAAAAPADTVFVGGSTFVVADLLSHLK